MSKTTLAGACYQDFRTVDLYLIEEERSCFLGLSYLAHLSPWDQGIIAKFHHAEMGIVRRISDFFQYEGSGLSARQKLKTS